MTIDFSKTVNKERGVQKVGVLPLLVLSGICLILMVIFPSCSQNYNPVAPLEESTHYTVPAFEPAVGQEPAQTAPRFLTWQSAALPKIAAVFTESKIIEADKGGVVGGESTYDIRVIIPPGALREDQTISVTLSTTNAVIVDFSPSYEFEKPVTIELSYRYANLAGVAVENLAVWYVSPSGGFYKLASEVNDGQQVVTADVNHFSRYGLSDD